LKCPLCNHDKWEDGYIQGRYNIKYKSNNSSLLQKSTVFGGQDVKAKLCINCGYLALTVKK